MNMTNISKLLIPAVALSLSACSSSSSGPAKSSGNVVIIGNEVPGGPSLRGSGKWTSAKRKVEQFHSIDLQDCAKVQVTVGMPLDVQVEADDNLLDAVDTKVEGGKLTVSLNKSFQTARAPMVTIGVPELSEIHLSGSGDIAVNAVKGDVFNVDVSGAGTMFGAGKVTNEKISISGAGSADCSKIKAENVTADVSGAGSCKVEAKTTLTAKVSGAGSVKYNGSPTTLNKDVSGSGSIGPLTP